MERGQGVEPKAGHWHAQVNSRAHAIGAPQQRAFTSGS